MAEVVDNTENLNSLPFKCCSKGHIDIFVDGGWRDEWKNP